MYKRCFKSGPRPRTLAESLGPRIEFTYSSLAGSTQCLAGEEVRRELVEAKVESDFFSGRS